LLQITCHVGPYENYIESPQDQKPKKLRKQAHVFVRGVGDHLNHSRDSDRSATRLTRFDGTIVRVAVFPAVDLSRDVTSGE